MEEEWMQRQGAGSDFQINVNSQTLLAGGRRRFMESTGATTTTTTIRTEGEMMEFGGGLEEFPQVMGPPRDFFLGFFLGFVIGFFALFWVWLPYTTQRKKLGIISGIGAQVFLGLGTQRERRGEIVDAY